MFYFSLPIIFYDVRLLSPGEFFLINCISLALLFFTAPLAQTAPSEAKDHYILNAWLGRLPLNSAFWPFFLLFNAILISSDLLVKFSYISVSSWDDIHSILVLPYLWWLVSVWRCSGHTSNRMWAALARLATLWIILEYGFILLIRIEYPRLFFSCDELFMNYSNCF